MNKDRTDVTLGLSLHRPELVPVMGDLMGDHDIIVLEEPKDAKFGDMLAKEIGIDAYLQELDIEYPIFSRNMCRLMQRLAAQDKKIVQVEPYLETLLGIHEFFADGGLPEELAENSLSARVYTAEKYATAALLSFYESLSGSFDEIVESVIGFARKDAARFKLRDELRAQALMPMLETSSSIFIESGLMHFGLSGLLRRQLSMPKRLQTVFLADRLLRHYGMKSRLYGPGDTLTLFYIFHPELEWPNFEKLLAARALVYNCVCPKNELEVDGDIPHLRNEVVCIEQVSHLSFNDCHHMYRRHRKKRSTFGKKLGIEHAQHF